MTKPVSSVPNVFATATNTIPLGQLDANFNGLVADINDLNTYSNFISDTGTVNSVVLNFPSGITTTSLAIGTQIQFKASYSNTGSTTAIIQINGLTLLGATVIQNEDGSTISASSILANGFYNITYTGTAWILGGGGGSGGNSAGGAVYENTQIINHNYTMTSGKNGESVGPITIASGITVIIPSGSRWVIL